MGEIEGHNDVPTEAKKAVPGVDFVVQESALAALNLDVILSPFRHGDVHTLHQFLSDTVKLKSDAGQLEESAAAQLLQGLTNYHFDPKDKLTPFKPMMVMGGRRTLVPGDLLPEQIAVLAAISLSIANTPLRARICDVSWLRNRANVECGFQAVYAYCQIISDMANGTITFRERDTQRLSVSTVDLVRRAVAIARALGWDKPEFDNLRKIISDITEAAATKTSPHIFNAMARINLQNRIWESSKIAKTAESVAQKSKDVCSCFAEHPVWELAAIAYRDERDKENEYKCLIEEAECFVREADRRVDSPFVQASFLNDAIQKLRPIPGTKERRRELQERMSAAQPEIIDHMSSFEHEMDITDLVTFTQEQIKGKTFREALRVLALLDRIPDPAQLRDAAIENSANSIIAMMPVDVTDHQGRRIFVAPGMDAGAHPEGDQLKFLVSRDEDLRRQLVVSGKIVPARAIIVNEHYIGIQNLIPFMEASPFVPPGHELIFAKGILSFISGEDIESAHLLLPQLENSLRYILFLHGIETTCLKQDGTQEEAMIGRILTEFREPLISILTDRFVDYIEMLFNFRGGPSIRNELAHGKMSSNDFWTPNNIYSVWFVIHLTLLPLIPHWDNFDL